MFGTDVYRLTVYTRIYSNGGYFHMKDYSGESDDKYLWQKKALMLSSDSSFQVTHNNFVIEDKLEYIVTLQCSIEILCWPVVYWNGAYIQSYNIK